MRRIILIISLYVILFSLKAQTKQVWLLLSSEQEIIFNRENKSMFKNTTYNEIIENCDINVVKKAFPFSKNDTLKRLYEVSCNQEKMQVLLSQKNIEHVYIQEEYENITLHNPSGYFWYYTTDTSVLWHLKKIQADLAWDITKGNSSVKITLLDTWFDINHPALRNKLYCNYDPYDNTPFSATMENHGSAVASVAAGETDGTSEYASVGFNCKVIPYQAHAGNYLQRAHHASLAMNADVLTSSAGGWSCDNNFNDIERIAVKEILDNGTVIVMPAGNGWNASPSSRCIINGELAPYRPLHPYYDERIIIVTGTNKKDKHTHVNENGEDVTHSHYSYVDICSPGHDVMAATGTLWSDGTVNDWPYWEGWGGTSIATPIVAGVCALLKSIDKNLTPAEIQQIIKATADPVADAYLYPGQLGSGRINAYKAVRMACKTTNFINRIVNTSQTITGCDIYSKNVTVTNNKKIILDAIHETIIDGPFEIQLGSELEIK